MLPAATLVVVYGALRFGGSDGASDGSPGATPAVTSRPTALRASNGATDRTEGPRQSPKSTEGATVAPGAVLVGAGDIADCSANDDEATAALLGTLDGTVFTLGDHAYPIGTSQEFERCYGVSWGHPTIKERTKPIPGNRDYSTPDALPYFEYFGRAAGDPAEGWYAYDAGTWRVYALNSNCSEIGGCDEGSPQFEWLRSDLAANPRECVAAMLHHPRFSSGREHRNSRTTEGLWTALYAAGAELVVAAHDHDYERFAPQNLEGALDERRGIVQFVVGTGGGRLQQFGTIRPNSLVRNDDTHGVLRLELSPGSWTFAFIPVGDRTFTDSGSGTCH